MEEKEDALKELEVKIRKSIKFLDDKLTDIHEEDREKFKVIKEWTGDLYSREKEIVSELTKSKSSEKVTEKQLKEIFEQLDMSTSYEWVREHVEYIKSNLLKELNDLIAECQVNKAVIDENRTQILRMSFSLDKMSMQIEELKQYSCGDKSHKAVLHEKLLDLEKNQAKMQDQINSKLEKFTAESDDTFSKHENLVEDIKKLNEKFESQYKRRLQSLTEMFEKRFDDVSETLTQESHKNEKLVQSFLKDFNSPQHPLQELMKSAKSMRNIDDFIKQVSFNARQIALIQQSLNKEV